MSKCEFKVGDKVVCVSNEGWGESFEKGGQYTVNGIWEHGGGYYINGAIVSDYFQNDFELVESNQEKSKYKLKHFEKDIRQWNERCGNVVATKEMTLEETCAIALPQAKVILEEAKELLKACEERNELEILDGSIDVLVTSLRLISLLKDKYDLMGAAKAVMENNHLKYTQNLDDIMFDEKWSVAGTKVIYTKVNDQHYYCLKDENGKIRKWNGFPKVDLSQFLVKGGE